MWTAVFWRWSIRTSHVKPFLQHWSWLNAHVHAIVKSLQRFPSKWRASRKSLTELKFLVHDYVSDVGKAIILYAVKCNIINRRKWSWECAGGISSEVCVAQAQLNFGVLCRHKSGLFLLCADFFSFSLLLIFAPLFRKLNCILLPDLVFLLGGIHTIERTKSFQIIVICFIAIDQFWNKLQTG